jgi:hypothetical protein
MFNSLTNNKLPNQITITISAYPVAMSNLLLKGLIWWKPKGENNISIKNIVKPNPAER